MIQFIFLEGKTAKEIHERIFPTLDDLHVFETIRFWVNEFKFGKISIKDVSRSGSPRKSTSNGSNEEASKYVNDYFEDLEETHLREDIGRNDGLRGDYVEK